jgi:hypothetical protein
MVHWEMCDDETHVGFQTEFPPGTYYIGNPQEMLLPEFLATICYLSSGAYEDTESDALIFLHTFSTTTFTMNTNHGQDTLIVSDTKVIAIMSEDMVKRDRKYDDQRMTFNSPTVIDLNGEYETIEIKNSDNTTCISHYDMGSDYQDSEYSRFYSSDGYNY